MGQQVCQGVHRDMFVQERWIAHKLVILSASKREFPQTNLSLLCFVW